MGCRNSGVRETPLWTGSPVLLAGRFGAGRLLTFPEAVWSLLLVCEVLPWAGHSGQGQRAVRPWEGSAGHGVSVSPPGCAALGSGKEWLAACCVHVSVPVPPSRGVRRCPGSCLYLPACGPHKPSEGDLGADAGGGGSQEVPLKLSQKDTSPRKQCPRTGAGREGSVDLLQSPCLPAL